MFRYPLHRIGHLAFGLLLCLGSTVWAQREGYSLRIRPADAPITLVAGVYDLHHTGSGLVAVVVGATSASVPPASAAAEVAGFLIPAGGVATVALDAGTLHARTLASTATLYLVRKALS